MKKTAKEVAFCIQEILKENDFKIVGNIYDPSMQIVSNVQRFSSIEESEYIEDTFFEFD